MKKLLFTGLMSVSFLMIGCGPKETDILHQLADIFSVYKELSEDEFKAISKLDASCCDKLNALPEKNYAFLISQFVDVILYFSQVDLLIEGMSEQNIQESYRLLHLFNQCRPVDGILSTILSEAKSDDEKRIVEEIKIQLQNVIK